jgi:hypothetical protein
VTARRPHARAALAVGLLVPALVTGGCTVGSGTGNAAGPVWVLGCNPDLPDGNYGTPNAPMDYSLNPIFFAGVPIEDITPVNENRLVIRMQRNGGPIEFNDTLAFDILNSYEVARCVRGRITPDGTPDWDVPMDPAAAWCDWSGAAPGADGGAAADGGATATRARIRITDAGFVQVSLALLATCPLKDGVALIGHSTDGGDAWTTGDGWIEFEDFGGAMQPQLAPDMRTAFGSTDFKVNYEERLRATFHVVLDDDRVITARRLGRPVPTPRFGAVLDGRFDFDLVRGRAAQPFP